MSKIGQLKNIVTQGFEFMESILTIFRMLKWQYAGETFFHQ